MPVGRAKTLGGVEWTCGGYDGWLGYSESRGAGSTGRCVGV